MAVRKTTFSKKMLQGCYLLILCTRIYLKRRSNVRDCLVEDLVSQPKKQKTSKYFDQEDSLSKILCSPPKDLFTSNDNGTHLNARPDPSNNRPSLATESNREVDEPTTIDLDESRTILPLVTQAREQSFSDSSALLSHLASQEPSSIWKDTPSQISEKKKFPGPMGNLPELAPGEVLTEAKIRMMEEELAVQSQEESSQVASAPRKQTKKPSRSLRLFLTPSWLTMIEFLKLPLIEKQTPGSFDLL